MYKVYCDNQLLNDNTRHVLHDNSTESCVIIDPHVHLEDNEVGYFSFRIASTHPYYSIISKLKSIITVESNGEEIFRGRPTEQRGDFNNTKEFYCEDELSYLTHSVQRQAEYHDISPRGFLETLIEVHNAQVEEDKHFVVGAVTVVDSNDSLYRYTNYEDTLTCIKTKLVKKLGGHLRIRIVNGVRYLDYLADYPRINTQEIEFGKNLLDFSQTVDVSDLATAVIPLGAYLETATIEALDERLSIRSVNNDVDFIYSASAVQNYGWKFKVVTFDDVHVPANLLRKGREYLTDAQFENLVLECSALDLSRLNVNIEQIMLLDQVRVHSEPHELNKLFPVSVLDIYLNNPEDNSIVLGNAERIASYTSSSISNDQKIMERINGIPSERVVLNEAIANATALINAATHGYVVLTPEELLIMNTDNTATAKKVWRWNLGGLGYSSSGYNGPYATAITMDGQIVGERIAAHSVSADKLSIEYVSEVERKISAAEANAKSDTDQKLTDYWTSAEVRTQIANTADSVLLSATEEAKSYTDSALSDYCTKAALRVEVSNITAEVSKKINASEWSTRIQQSATDIQIAWNNISRYIQFADAKLQIKDESNNPLIELSHTGMEFSYKNKAIGRIGCFSTLGTNHTGLEFELNNSAEYMAWVVRASGQIASSAKLVYANDNIYNGYKAGLHFACETYSDGNLYLDDNNNIKLLESGVGYEGVFSFGDYNSSSNVFDRRITLSKNYFNIWNNVGINFYSALNMHNYVIYNTNLVNSSDSRLKTNIQPTKINALDFINALELKQFEWIESGEFEPVGVIAQQLQEIAPELVEEVDGKLSIKTTKFIFYLLKAVQELSDKSGKSTKSKWQDPYSDEEKRDFCKGYNDELDGLSKISARTKAIPSTEHKSPKNKKGDSNGRK